MWIFLLTRSLVTFLENRVKENFRNSLFIEVSEVCGEVPGGFEPP
jgi:hypothetical protein